MKRDLLEVLCCPACREDLSLKTTIGDVVSVTEGRLKCTSCLASYPIVRGVPRFVDHDGYVGSFSYEWNKWNRVQLDIANGSRESEDTFAEKAGFQKQELAGKLVLDVGCGAGRFLDVASRWGARAIGIDFSYAVEASQRNLGHRPNVDVIQADVFRLPFKDEVFDIIFSLGVLHHTRDTRDAFLSLPRHLKPGGDIAVWLYYYTDKVYNAASDFWRRVFRHMPNGVTYAWCWLMCLLFSDLFRQPFMSRWPFYHVRRVLPVNTHSKWSWRVLDTFDWISPRYQDKDCSPERVIEWCDEVDVRDIEILSFPTSIRARKDPARVLPLIKNVPDLRQKRLAVFGAGAAGQQAFEELRRIGVAEHVVAVFDNDATKAGSSFEGVIVRPFDGASNGDCDHIIVASQHGWPSISQQLTRRGLVHQQDFFSLHFIRSVSGLFRVAANSRA